MTTRSLRWSGCAALAALLCASSAAAQTVPAAPPPSTLTPAEQKARYSLPWGLRPAIAPNLVRLDSVYSLSNAGNAWVSVLTAGYRPIASAQTVGFYLRGALVGNYPGAGENQWSLSNPLLMAMWTPEVAPGVRIAPFLGLALPLGAGGGNTPDMNPDARAAMGAGIYPRQAMDNALFATNYLTPVVGFGAAYVRNGLTLQAEVTLLQLIRVRGDAMDTDDARTNFTSGLHVGYQVIPALTLSAEAHYQHWLSTPAAVTRTPSMRAQFTAGVGARANIPISRTALVRPGVAFFMPVGGRMGELDYRVMQFDVALPF